MKQFNEITNQDHYLIYYPIVAIALMVIGLAINLYTIFG